MKTLVKLKKYIPKEVIPKQGNNKKLRVKNDEDIYFVLSCKKSKKEIKIPQKIILDEQDFIAIGLYLAEGYTRVNFNAKYFHDGSISFAGSDQKMLDPICDFLNKFLISKMQLSWKIGLNRNLQRKPQEAINFWIKNLELNKNTLRKTSFYLTGTLHKKVPISTGQHGCVHLFFSSVVFRSFFLSFIQKIFTECLEKKDKTRLALILKGFFAGDGNVNYCKKHNRKMVDFACNNITLINQLKKALQIIGLRSVKETFPERTNVNNKSLRIYNLHDFKILNKYKIPCLLNYKKETFSKLLSSY